MDGTGRRISYGFLCAVPFLVVLAVGVRALRIPGLHEALGCALFLAIMAAAWTLGLRVIGSAASSTRTVALAGALLIGPSAMMALLWIGLGAPFQATTAENEMRYLVLLGNSILVSGGFLAMERELDRAGERFYSTLGLAASLPAGMAYLVAISLSAAQTMTRLAGDASNPPALLVNLYSVWEFVAATLTYVATAAFAASLADARWLGRGAARAYVVVSVVFTLLLVARGVSYPELSSSTAPWYARPGFIAGIPAIPWIMPALLGVVLLRRAGGERPS